ncbi:MAG TPA: LemA family protein [bacterium]|nr:LemA family protein [bacterium]
MTGIIVIGVAALAALLVIGLYNSFIKLRNEVKNAWAQIDVQLKRRHDLIPNLMETAKGYMKHERETLEAITKARNLAQSAGDVPKRGAAESQLGSALMKFFAVAEQYPDLKANQNFLSLQEELAATENKIAFARQFFNDSAMKYNTKIQSAPANIFAGMFGFREEKMFELDSPAEREVPKVGF